MGDWIERRLLFPNSESYGIFQAAVSLIEDEADHLPYLPSVRLAEIVTLMSAEIVASRAGYEFSAKRQKKAD